MTITLPLNHCVYADDDRPNKYAWVVRDDQGKAVGHSYGYSRRADASRACSDFQHHLLLGLTLADEESA